MISQVYRLFTISNNQQNNLSVNLSQMSIFSSPRYILKHVLVMKRQGCYISTATQIIVVVVLVLAPCKPKTDLIFVLDRSGSIRDEDYNKMREFVTEIAKELKVGETNGEGEIIGQAAIVTFSELGEKRMTLAESQDAEKFYDLVATMPGPKRQGRTKTHRGLRVADKEIAIKEAGYREDDPDVKKMIMVITDGKQTKESVRRGFVYVGDAMKPFFKRKMDVFAIGVGLDNEDAVKEVKDMVEVPENAILAANYSDLLYRVESIIKKFCPGNERQNKANDYCYH
jgi:uncharacterized protein YegL